MQILRIDGFVLLFSCIAVIAVAQSYRRWMFRVPLFALGCCYFLLAVAILGDRHVVSIPWPAARFGADCLIGLLALLHLRYGHAAKAGHSRLHPASES